MNPTRACVGRRSVSARRGFTLIELVLAMSLGAIVVASCVAVFAMLERSGKAQTQRLDRAQQLAVTHRTMSAAFATLLMTDAQLPTDDELKKRITDDMDSAGEDRAATPEPGLARFTLQPSPGMTFKSGKSAQMLTLTLRTPPIVGGLQEAGTDETGLSADQVEVLRRQAQTGTGLPGTKKRTGPEQGPSSRLLLGLVNSQRDDALSTRLLSETVRLSDEEGLTDPTPNGLLPAKAPGLRGRFELRPAASKQAAGNRPASENSGGYGFSGEAEDKGMALWWIQYPPGVMPPETSGSLGVPAAAAPDETETRASSAADDAGSLAERLANARQARAQPREIMLLEGIKDATWRVYRQKKFVTKIKAEYDRELPAYVEFAFTTDDGRNEKWAFQVAWANGPEPGSLLQNKQAPLAADTLGGAGGSQTLIGPDGKPLLGPDGQPVTLTTGPDGRPVASGPGPDGKPVTVSFGNNGQPVITFNGKTITPSGGGGATGLNGSAGPGGKGSTSTTNPGSIGPGGVNRDEVLRLVNERLRQLQGGGK